MKTYNWLVCLFKHKLLEKRRYWIRSSRYCLYCNKRYYIWEKIKS